MSDYLTRLVELTLGLAPTVRPRTVPTPGIIVPDQRVVDPTVVDAGDGRPVLREAGARDTLHETTPPQGPDEAGDETSLAGPATTPRAPNNAATPSRGPQTGDPSVTRGPSARPETAPTGEDPAPPHLVPMDEANRPAAVPSASGHRQAGEEPPMDTPEEVRRGRTSPASRPAEHAGKIPAPPVEDETGPASGLLPLVRRDEEPFPERSVSGGRAPTPVEPRAAAEPRHPGETRPQTRDAAVRNRGDDPGPGPALPRDGSPGRVRSFGAPTFALGARERPPGLPETSDPAEPERLVELPDSPALVGGPSVRRDGAAGSSEDLPAVRITIGRVEARAIPTGEAPARSATRAPGASSERRGPALSLDDYLKRRGGRG